MQLDLAKDEKYPKGKPFVPAQYEAFTVYDDNNKKEESVTTFQIYEDQLEKETTHVLRESVELVDVKNRETITLKEEIITKETLTVKSSEFGNFNFFHQFSFQSLKLFSLKKFFVYNSVAG